MKRHYLIFECANGHSAADLIQQKSPDDIELTHHTSMICDPIGVTEWLEEAAPEGDYGRFLIGEMRQDGRGFYGRLDCGMEFAIRNNTLSLYYAVHNRQENSRTICSNPTEVIEIVGGIEEDWEYDCFDVECLLWRNDKVAEYNYRDFKELAE